MQTIINNTLINYSDDGSGEVLLCIHGWMHDHTSFKNLIAELGMSYRIIAVDLPNFGSSQITEKTVTISDYAQFMKSFIEKLQLNSFIIIGHSMGCQIALYATGENIIQPKKLVLVAAAGVRSQKKGINKSLKHASKLVRHVIPKSYKKKFYSAIGSDYNPDLSEIHKKIIGYTLSTDIQDQLKNIKIPTLLINGSNDTDTPVWMAETLRNKITDSRLEIIENEGHLLHQTAANDVAECITKFI